MGIITVLFKQLFRKPDTNPFPAKHAPDKLSDIKKINPPIEVPSDYRGKIKYDRTKCIGCKLCISVCPANAIEFAEKDKKIKHYVSRCIMCGECTDVCPVKCLKCSQEFLLADTDKESKNLIEK
jgi:formate hydrogenlyase subunit 6/NADH:ubiquinone oxidoreductase subunit I